MSRPGQAESTTAPRTSTHGNIELSAWAATCGTQEPNHRVTALALCAVPPAPTARAFWPDSGRSGATAAAVDLSGRSALHLMELLLLYARQTVMGTRRRSLVLVLCSIAVAACDGGQDESAGRSHVEQAVNQPRRRADAGRPRRPMPARRQDGLRLRSRRVRRHRPGRGWLRPDRRLLRRSVAVLFPHGVSWSAADNGIVTSDGDVAHLGEWIYGGGTSPLADLDALDLTDEQQSEITRCIAASAATASMPSSVEQRA